MTQKETIEMLKAEIKMAKGNIKALALKLDAKADAAVGWDLKAKHYIIAGVAVFALINSFL